MSELVWVLIREDAGGNRYRVARYATRTEAEQVAAALAAAGGAGGPGANGANGTAGGGAGSGGHGQVYVIEHAGKAAGE
jgi:hypothetical protein